MGNLRELDSFMNSNEFLIYGAGEFAYSIVNYCATHNTIDNIKCCVVTEKGVDTDQCILGIPVVDWRCLFDFDRQTKILIAILSDSSADEVGDKLREMGYNNLYFASRNEFFLLNKENADFGIAIKADIKRLGQRVELKLKTMALLTRSMPMVVHTHMETFAQYKDINKGKEIVICASGPSLNKYKYNEKYIHIGLNSTLFEERIKLDYFFMQDLISKYHPEGREGYSVIRNKYLEYLPKADCVKFIGGVLGEDWWRSPPFGEFSGDGYKNYYIFPNEEVDSYNNFSADIRYNLLIGVNSVVFPALQFALFTNPKKIFLVGCDGHSTDGPNYYSKENSKYKQEMMIGNGTDLRKHYKIINEYRLVLYTKFKKFADVHYPNTRIVMVNPVHYKGIFEETYTDEVGNIMVEA